MFVLTNVSSKFDFVSTKMSQEIRVLKEKISSLTLELEKTKADNVKLYGKIRYVQDYNLEKVVSRGSKKVKFTVNTYIP